MSRKGLLTFTLVGLLLISGILAARVWSPALSAASACRHAMEHTEGYGPWRVQATHLVDAAQGSEAVASFFDGYNTASCHAQRYGPIWIVVGLGQTMVGCSRELSADGAQECPRAMFGVIP